MTNADDIIQSWRRVINYHDYSEIDKISLPSLKQNRSVIQKEFSMQGWVMKFNDYIREREIREAQEKKDTEREGRDRRKWLIAFIAMPLALLLINQLNSFVNLYFQELRNRPYIYAEHQEVRIVGNHVEHRADGTSYEDKTRKDMLVNVHLENSGNTPANIICIETWLSYGKKDRFKLTDKPRRLVVSPKVPSNFVQNFMMLNDYVNDFVLEVKIRYYGGKFLGWKYKGRPYEHYCRARWNGQVFSIEESEDIR